jgi:hypothetical protein
MLKFANRVGQVGVFRTGSPAYAELTGSAIPGWVTFATAAVADSWDDADSFGVLVKKDNANWAVYTASWESTGPTINLNALESSLGTLADNDAVELVMCATRETLKEIAAGLFVTDATTARTLSEADHCQTIRFTSSSAVTVAIAAGLHVGFQCMLIQEGLGLVSCDPQSTDTLNGGTSNCSLAGQFASALLYQPSEGTWVLLA